MTSGAVAKMLGTSRQGVHYLVKNDPTFPAPSVDLPTGRLWEREEIERWARETGRLK
jgi:predicted DNA-binding transcriptional regulator AlpA